MKKGTFMTKESKEKIKIARARQVFSAESNQKRSASLKGRKKPPGFGENLRQRNLRRPPMTDETKRKISEARMGRKISEETRVKLSESHRGKKSRFWEGGITPLNLAIRRTFRYRLWRNDVFTRDNFTCQSCFKKGIYIEADHIYPFCLILKDNKICSVEESLLCEELWDINNGRTLCKECHKKTDTYKKKARLIKNNERRKRNNKKRVCFSCNGKVVKKIW